MSTNANINIRLPDGKYKSIYLHWDGYPSHAFKTLVKHYSDQDKAAALVELGDISCLYDSIECPEGHSYENAVEGYTIAYHRDRGEDWEHTQPKVSDEPNDDNTYNYLFENGEWRII